jgi:hypothetical protein
MAQSITGFHSLHITQDHGLTREKGPKYQLAGGQKSSFNPLAPKRTSAPR